MPTSTKRPSSDTSCRTQDGDAGQWRDREHRFHGPNRPSKRHRHRLIQWAKAGLHSLTQHLAMELAEHGIRVNAVSPAVVKTPIYEGSFPKTGG